ncbi:cullulin 3 [Apiospora rasikravindrae]|uniref:Cullulin 3 n=1 Tax=Apiospora rasikravindrae TaxID=990691 RepID=A0ABR1RND7_9PEZI
MRAALSSELLCRYAYKIVLKKAGGRLYENVKQFEESTQWRAVKYGTVEGIHRQGLSSYFRADLEKPDSLVPTGDQFTFNNAIQSPTFKVKLAHVNVAKQVENKEERKETDTKKLETRKVRACRAITTAAPSPAISCLGGDHSTQQACNKSPVRDVWRDNMDDEIGLLRELIDDYQCVAMVSNSSNCS